MGTFESIIPVLNYLAPLLALTGGFYFAHRFVRALERRADGKAELTELRARVAQLEEAQELTERELLRVQTAQEFSTQLLGARMASAIASPNDPAAR